MGKKRVLLVVRWPVGGIRTFIRYVYRRFDASKYHFDILVPEHPEIAILERDLEGIDFTVFRMSEKPSLLELFFRAALMLSRGRYDLVHSHGFISGMCLSLPAFVLRTPHILTSHDMLSDTLFKGVSGKIKKAVMGSALSLVNTIHTVSHDAGDNLSEFFPFLGTGSGKCVVIPNGIETETFLEAVPVDLRAELGVGEDVFLIGFLGRFMSLKGFSYLVDAMETLLRSGRLAKRPMVLAFGGGGFVREEQEALAQRGLEDHFRFFPFTTNVAGVIKGLDLVVMPSVSETCPLLPMEVLTCGVPLLTSNCQGLREVVRDTPTRTVPARDADSLAREIIYFIDNDTTRTFADFSPVARERYHVQRAAEAIKHLYARYV